MISLGIVGTVAVDDTASTKVLIKELVVVGGVLAGFCELLVVPVAVVKVVASVELTETVGFGGRTGSICIREDLALSGVDIAGREVVVSEELVDI